MEGFTVFFLAVYVALGFGVQRTFKKIGEYKGSTGKELGDSFVTLFIWPVLLAIVALNNEFFD